MRQNSAGLSHIPYISFFLFIDIHVLMARDAKNSEIFQECKHMLEVLCFLQYTVQIVKLALIFPAGIWFQLTRPKFSIS
jgi:hypothetical protein